MLTPAFVIHSRPYRESSQLIDLFTQHRGRLTVVARGSRGPRSPLKGLLQPFTLLTLSWRGKGELKNLTQVECPDHTLRLSSHLLFYGLYLNELIYYLLEAHSPFPDVFAAYGHALMALTDGETPELPLRRFEFVLLQALGYGVSFEYSADSGAAIEPNHYYTFEQEQGFISYVEHGDPYNVFCGAHLLALAKQDMSTPALLQAAKRFSRLALQPYLGSRKLKSRELFLQRNSPLLRSK